MIRIQLVTKSNIVKTKINLLFVPRCLNGVLILSFLVCAASLTVLSRPLPPTPRPLGLPGRGTDSYPGTPATSFYDPQSPPSARYPHCHKIKLTPKGFFATSPPTTWGSP